MRAGPLNQRIALQYRAAGVDAAGQPTGTWTELAAVWANIALGSGLESVKADRETSVVRASIRIRWRTDVTAAMRVLHGATVYEVMAVKPDLQRREFVDLVCEVRHG